MKADGVTLLILDFPARPPGGPEQAAALRALADSIAQEPGLLWKIWTGSTAEGRAGGAYLFESRAAAEAYHRMHADRLGRAGVTGIEATYREINEPLSRITRAPIP
ncbi:monooxygenase [Paracraurococcus ruber]|uniref:Monooxygenase n=1 Tax=Paracraurococcus ruber TaxID=77675 RepID=A0ABS1CS55_9PROT|nr:monooxygenase [Paracraurococcus ruber]MBK1657170.1 monooxygenase [Paracraurococcus ruber]TDG31120.1 monooxygenase [Paracraurococcus ruber]